MTDHGDLEIERFVKRNLAISNTIRKILDERNLSDKDFAQMQNKNPSEVCKWLSGSHNLTQKSIIKMEIALGVQIVHIEPVEMDA